MLEGIVAAHPRHVKQLPASPRSLVAVDGPRPGEVGIVIGGGSGRKPSFLGFVGKGLADAGRQSATYSPRRRRSPPFRRGDGRQRRRGRAVRVWQLRGRRMNFDMASEMLAGLDGIEVRTVLTTDDIASARSASSGAASPATSSSSRRRARRPTACCAAGRRSSASPATPTPAPIRSASRSAPARCRRRGGRISRSRRARWRSAWACTASPECSASLCAPPTPWLTRSWTRIFHEMDAKPGDRVAVLVNSLGATPLMELYILHRRVAQRVAAAGLETAFLAGWSGLTAPRWRWPAPRSRSCTSMTSCNRC